MRCLVTGGAGFIGSTLVDRLLAGGHEVVVVDDFSSGSEANLASARESAGDRLTVHAVDIRDEGVTALVAGSGAEVVFHLAAQADVRVSVARPAHDASINVIGLLNVLEGAREGATRKVVFASSGGTIYGEPDPSVLPVDESQPELPIAPYGVAKKVGTDYLRAYRAVHGLDWTSLALANVYGPRQDPHGEAGVVAIFLGRLLDGEQCRIFGDGSQSRDYVYVGDVAQATLSALDGDVGGVMNIGTGVATSVLDLYEACRRVAGSDAEPVHEPARAGELGRSVLNGERASAAIGFRAETSLATGVASTWQWLQPLG